MGADKPLNANTVLILLLSLATGFGLICGLLYVINIDLNSDMIVPGLVAKEIAEYQNFQFYFPAADPYLFTDVYTFYLLPQILSGYNPFVLKLTAFYIFLLTLSIFSLLIYKNAGTVNALIFSALLTNISPEVYLLYLTPEYHIGTLLGAGILILLLNFKNLPQLTTPKILLLGLVAALVFYSDTIILLLFIVPYLAYYLYYRIKKPDQPDNLNRKEAARLKASRQKEGSKLDGIAIVLVSAVVLMTLIRIFFNENRRVNAPNLIDTPTALATINTVLSLNLSVFIRSLTYLVNPNLYHITTDGLSVYGIILSLIFLLVLAYSFLKRDKNNSYIYGILLLGSVFLSAGFLVTNWAKDLTSARYLLLIPVAVFSIISLAYRKPEKAKPGVMHLLFIIGVFVLLLSSVPASIAKISGLDYQSNQADYELGAYLRANNFTYGFSDYWTAHVVTYLSGGDLRIYPVEFDDEGTTTIMNPISWLTTKRWYYSLDNDFVIIESNNSSFSGDLANFVADHPPVEVFHFKDYNIYHYQLPDETPSRWFY